MLNRKLSLDLKLLYLKQPTVVKEYYIQKNHSYFLFENINRFYHHFKSYHYVSNSNQLFYKQFDIIYLFQPASVSASTISTTAVHSI